MSKTPKQSGKLEKIAELAMRLGSRHLDDYGSARSRHDFTQRPLMNAGTPITVEWSDTFAGGDWQSTGVTLNILSNDGMV